jgi:hypothetical protein
MKEVKKYLKDWLVGVAAISIIVIVVILTLYFSQTHGAFEWGDFGGLLSAIAGLIAFVGVLFTLRQTKQQSLDSEDRSVFFELLKIFTSYRDALRVKKIDWIYDNKQYQWNITPYDEFCTPEKTYRQIFVELYHTFYLEIQRTIPKNFSKEEFAKKIISPKMSKIQCAKGFGQLTTAIGNIYAEDSFRTHGGLCMTTPVHLNAYDYLCLNAIKIYFEQGNLNPIAEAYARAADHCFKPYINQLGTYFRNAYYILEMASEFNSPKNYSKIFRAQLSKYELVLLFFNSFGPLSTPKTRELYLNADLFNNLELKDVRLKDGTNDEAISRLEYIVFPPLLFKTDNHEFVSRDLLKKLYDAIT